ncbi:hypothetical protein PENSPDRAFT_755597 [Peniophora sp. CONT]|nr:hypothetical protein PENSPDRAFT_755597 [Peniophora sp. CONT]
MLSIERPRQASLMTVGSSGARLHAHFVSIANNHKQRSKTRHGTHHSLCRELLDRERTCRLQKHVVDRNIHEFFNIDELPHAPVSEALLAVEKAPAGLSKEEDDFFTYMEDALKAAGKGESATIDFVSVLLRLLRYDVPREGKRLIHSLAEMGFIMCGQMVDVVTDLVVVKRDGGNRQYLFLLQEDQRHSSKDKTEPQLIAKAIAAFSTNRNSSINMHREPATSHTFPGIVMVGTTPVFFKIPVTEELRAAVSEGVYPNTPTIVERLVAPLPDPSQSDRGLQAVANRQLLLQCFEALKAYLGAD